MARVREARDGEAFRVRTFLAPGNYVVEAESDARHRGEATASVESSNDPISIVRIQMR